MKDKSVSLPMDIKDNYVKELEAKNGELEKKLAIALDCLNLLPDFVGDSCTELIEEALVAINGASNE